ncbi:hypothetical protein [Variovorax sp. OK605]|uniref:hypothetical protein n=1 Tax=Variovorax sp. OK605 TaxID=1855317 RepID=UPI0011603F45|nr:hypothetical protein [Variovorax sp. OK605]
MQKQVTDGKNGGGECCIVAAGRLVAFLHLGQRERPGCRVADGRRVQHAGRVELVRARHRHPPSANCQLPTANCQLGSGTPCSTGGASIQKNLIDHGLGWFAGTDPQRWSSTQASLTEGWAHTRTEGSVSATGKATGLPVRCVASVNW